MRTLPDMARPEGFEPPTTWFVARYSIQLSYGRKIESRIFVLFTGSVNSRQGPPRDWGTPAWRLHLLPEPRQSIDPVNLCRHQ